MKNNLINKNEIQPLYDKFEVLTMTNDQQQMDIGKGYTLDSFHREGNNENNTILIIDDEEIIRISIMDAFKKDGYNFIETSNVKDGLKALEKYSPVLIILDLRMPIMSGLDFLKKIKPKASDPFSIIVLTGNSSEIDMKACFDLGVIAFLNKPIDVLHLRGLVKQNILLKTYQAEIKYRRNHLQEIVNLQIRDIEEKNFLLNETVEKLQISEKSYRDLIDRAPVPITIHDKTGYIYANKEAISMAEMDSLNDMIGRDPLEFLRGDYKRIIGALMDKSIKSEKPVPITHEIFISDKGNEHHINFVAMPVVYQERLSVLSIGLDITTTYQLEEQLRQAQKMEAVGQLAGGIAHDFNNILTSIMGYADLGKMFNDDPKAMENYFTYITAKSSEAAQLVKQLMSFSRIQELTLETVDLHVLIHDFTDFIRKSIRDDIEIEENENYNIKLGFVDVDIICIKQILSNLMLNAQQAMPDGGKITISGEFITIAKEDCKGYKHVTPGEFIRVSISDTGSGISDEIIHRIFDPFFTTKIIGEGTGLGLSIVYNLLEKHHGFVTVESNLKQGTTFHIYLPKSKSRIQTTVIDKNAIIPTNKDTVLIVEDDQDILNILKALLDNLGYNTDIAKNGIEALEKLLVPDNSIKLTISDIVMPKMKGHELIQKAKDANVESKFILMSGYSNTSQAEKSTISDIPYLQKPFTLQTATKIIREVLTS